MNESKENINPDSKLVNWKNPPSLLALKQDYTDANSEADKHFKEVVSWLDALHIQGKAKLKIKNNKSQIQPKLIRKQAEWRYAALTEPFLSTPDVFNVYPVTYEDKEGAIQNELVLNYQFNCKMNKTKFIDDYIRTAVNEGTVIVRTGWEYEEQEVEKEVPVYSSRINNSPAFIQAIQQVMAQLESNPESEKELPPELLMSVQSTLQSGVPTQVFVSGYETVKEIEVVKNHPTATVCDYKNVIPDPTCEGDFTKAKFVIYRFPTSLSELKRTGLYKNLDRINLTGNSVLADPDSSTSPDNSSFNFNDDARKVITAYEYWGYWDIDGNGIVKPIVVTWVGDTIIRMDENPFPDKKIPFIFVSYLPRSQSLYGEPDGELIKDNQDIIGAVTRGMIDILAANANGQKGFAKNVFDAVNKRRFQNGEDFEYNPNSDISNAFYVNKFSEIPQSAQFMYQQQSLEAESMTGVKAFSQGISGQALGDTATGVRGALDAASKRELGILRRLADGIIQIGRKFISMNSEFLSDEEIVRVTNEQFVAISRDKLAGQYDLRLSISTAEEDNQKAQEIAFMLQTMGQSLPFEMTQMLLSDIARLRKMPDLAQRIKEYQPQPDPLAQRKAELEIALLEAQVMETQAEAQQRAAVAQYNAAKAGEAQANTDLKNLDFVEQESGVKQERDLQKMSEQARSNAQLEVVKAALNPKTSA